MIHCLMSCGTPSNLIWRNGERCVVENGYGGKKKSSCLSSCKHFLNKFETWHDSLE